MKKYIAFASTFLSVSFFVGCASSRDADAEAQNTANALGAVAAFTSAAEADVENAGISENREIGIVIMSDPATKTLVAQLNAGESVPVGTELVVRRMDLTPVAWVMVKTVNRRTIGASVLRGSVSEGQLVVVPNAVLKAKARALPELP